MRRFRETFWFKYGATGQATAEVDETRASDETRPVEDRYQDPALSLLDQAEFGLHTGTTSAIPRIGPVAKTETVVSEEVLVKEMRTGAIARLGALIRRARRGS